jgi:hypothetical protein
MAHRVSKVVAFDPVDAVSNIGTKAEAVPA